MSQTSSVMIELGIIAHDFNLTDTKTGNKITLSSLKSDKAIVIMFICNHCPYVKHINSELVNLANDYIPKGINFAAISSNDAQNYPEDSPEKMKEYAEALGYPFPYLYDETQEIAKLYGAACTPDFYIYDKNLRLVYRGQLDDSRPKTDIPVTGKDIRKALNNILEDKEVDINQRPSIGCNIKWK